MVSRYVNGPVKHEGICLLPPPPSHHYRMVPTQAPRDSFQLSNQNYVQQQPTQAGSQGAGLRGIGQTGPPNQAPTPPNQDLKVQTVPQQAPMNLYQTQSAVRPSQQFSYRPQGPPNQNPRMANSQHRGQQQIYQTTAPQFVQMPMASNMYINPVPYFNTGQPRQNFVQPQVILQGQHFPTYTAFAPTALTQTPSVPYPFYPAMPRAPQAQPTSAPSNPNQTSIPTLPLAQPMPTQPTMPRQGRRRPNAIAIIDPNTGVNKLDEMFEQDNSSHPPSGESSARQTPQPAPHNPNKEVQATFAKQVAQVLNKEDQASYDDDRHSSTGDHMEASSTFHPPQQPAVHNNPKYDHLAQNSTLKVYAKEFVSKETPVVSAMCDSEEVTLPNKQQKGRESPAKGRKPKDHHREATKDVHIPKEVHQQPEKQQQTVSVVKDEAPKVKETNIVSQSNSHQVPKPGGDKETDKRKKEMKSDNKTNEPNSNECVAGQLSPNLEHESSLPASAKTKQRKEAQKPNHKPSPPNVPAPQPAKSNSKTSKKNEINNKGASKEGTEMDVFQIADSVNANLPAVTNNNDVINANTTPAPVTNNAISAVNSNSNVVDSYNKKNENKTTENVADTATIKPITENKPSQMKVDVTMVFGGKVLKPPPFTPAAAPVAADTNRDETDRAAIVNDKLIQAKNEVNTTKTAHSTDVIENKSDLPYKKGQWSPFNVDGDKKYDRDFLMAVRNLPITKIKPDNLPDIVDISLDGNRQRLPDNRYSMGRTDFTTPPFMSAYGGKNSSMKGPSITKHPSLTGKMNSKGGKSTNGANKISISLREEIKLHEAENAWKPLRLAKSDPRADDEKKTDDLYKKVRGVLNKLTPQKFDTLLNQIKHLKIENIERLQGVINLVFEKAVDEPNFSVAYAKMCKELSLMQVPVSVEKKDEFVNFRKLLINRCQEEFEKQSKDETCVNEKKKEIEETTDLDKKKELEFELEEIHRRIRMRSVGNVRFIGELFKIQMLTANIMLQCLTNLVAVKDEESLECLCKLLSTVGKELEDNNNRDLSKFFNIMQDIVDKKGPMKCSSRIRFMLQDVIDLRRNKWVPRRQDMNPKTIDQIQREAENEQMNQAINNSVPSTPRKDERSGGDMKKGNVRTTDDGWTLSRNQRTNNNASFTLQKDKLKMQKLGDDEPLGQSRMFQNWSKGSQLNSQPAAHPNLTSNKYALLDSGSIDMDKKLPGSGSRYKEYSSKGSSLERSNYGKQSYDNRAGSRSGSQQRMNEAPVSTQIQRAAAAPAAAAAAAVAPVATPAPAKPAPAPAPLEMTDEQRDRYFKNILEEFINDNSTFEECEVDIKNTFPISYMRRMVADGYLSVLEKYPKTRLKTGILFAKLIKVGTLPLEEYCVGLEEIFSQVEDLIIDIPTIFTCLAQIIVPVLCEEVLPFTRLQKSCSTLIENKVADKLLAAIFKHIVSEKGPNYLRNLWQLSELKLTDFMPSNVVDNFVKDNQLEFLSGGAPKQGNSELNFEQIEEKLLEFFEAEVPFDDICNWITANVGERVKDNQFIRTLATAIYKYSIVRVKLESERLNRHHKLFQKYVDNNPVYELQCLYALQALVHKMEHPQGLLLAIFNKLSEDLIFPQECFIAWETSQDPAEQEGKGVALKQLTAFFTQLKENDEEEEDDYGSSASDEA